MTINDEIIRQIVKALESSDAFLGTLAAGDGFDDEAFNHFIEKMRSCRLIIAGLPGELRNICMGLIEIPMLMQNSIAIVDQADRERFESSILEVSELFCDLFGSRSDDQ